MVIKEWNHIEMLTIILLLLLHRHRFNWIFMKLRIIIEVDAGILDCGFLGCGIRIARLVASRICYMVACNLGISWMRLIMNLRKINVKPWIHSLLAISINIHIFYLILLIKFHKSFPRNNILFRINIPKIRINILFLLTIIRGVSLMWKCCSISF